MQRQGNRGNSNRRGKYSVSELRHPVDIGHATTLPTEESADFETRVKFVAQVWTCYKEGPRRKLKGKDSDGQAVHLFGCRYDPALELQADYLIFHDDMVFKIESWKRDKDFSDFMDITTTILASRDSLNLVLERDAEPPRQEPINRDASSFWD